ncbi:hypothetical protein EGW08_016932 [Elysia chlorotica]|uniref:Uncharacterized protein n=1 Tax=Elysia chlorotica TaxID=188477 RepID=A0A3S0ZBU9_ELYCH|nr:hypothetical protein EGW08_016932 [Elysia chlorotica]
MTCAGDCMIRGCRVLQKTPAALLCVALAVLQMAVLDYYLTFMFSAKQLAWVAVDLVNVAFLIFVIVQARCNLYRQNKPVSGLAWVSWLLLMLSVSVKVSVLVLRGVDRLEGEQNTFWSANTLKTAIAVSAVVFLLLLITQHDEELGSHGKAYIDELTGTVVFDIMDTVEIFDTLLVLEERKLLWPSLKEAILAVAVVNLVLPTVPLFTLARTQFGRKQLQKRLIYLHRLLGVLIVNVPNLAVRMILWHGHSIGISPFTLKNVVLIFLTTYEFYEHKKMKFELHEREKNESRSRPDCNIESAKDENFSEPTTIMGNASDSAKDIPSDAAPIEGRDVHLVDTSGDHLPYEEDFAIESRVVTQF